MNKIKFTSPFLKEKKISRDSIIFPYHVGKTFNVHDGQKTVPLLVSSNMRGYRFGEFCLTRKRFSHKKKKDKKK